MKNKRVISVFRFGLGTTLVSLLGMMAGSAQAEVQDVPCALVSKVGRGVQIIPEKGRVKSKVDLDQPVSCGSMIITHSEPLWLKLSNQTVVKLGPDTFIEIPAGTGRTYRLYRGVALLSAPASLLGQTWSTPNAEIDFKGGVTVLQYLPRDKTSIAGCFNRKVEFKNKFNTNATQTLEAGEMSHLAIQEARVRPSHPDVMHYTAVNQVLTQVGMEKEEKEQLVAVAKQVYEDRSKSLVSEIEEWGEGEDGPSRSIASIPKSSKKTVDPKEAAFTLKLMKDRLYGTSEEQAKYVPKMAQPSRAPASVQDVEKEKSEQIFKKETKRIEKEIERLDPDSIE